MVRQPDAAGNSDCREGDADDVRHRAGVRTDCHLQFLRGIATRKTGTRSQSSR